MVLYIEGKPDDVAIGSVVTADLRARPDAVIVLGISMEFLARKGLSEKYQVWSEGEGRESLHEKDQSGADVTRAVKINELNSARFSTWISFGE